MSSISSLAGTASLIGEPARTVMLVALMDGRALTAGELAEAAGVSAPTASWHLSRLLEGGMLALDRQGRHRYYRLANAAVATMLESMMALGEVLDGSAAIPRKPIVTGPRDKALRHARLCSGGRNRRRHGGQHDRTRPARFRRGRRGGNASRSGLPGLARH